MPVARMPATPGHGHRLRRGRRRPRGRGRRGCWRSPCDNRQEWNARTIDGRLFMDLSLRMKNRLEVDGSIRWRPFLPHARRVAECGWAGLVVNRERSTSRGRCWRAILAGRMRARLKPDGRSRGILRPEERAKQAFLPRPKGRRLFVSSLRRGSEIFAAHACRSVSGQHRSSARFVVTLGERHLLRRARRVIRGTRF